MGFIHPDGSTGLDRSGVRGDHDYAPLTHQVIHELRLVVQELDCATAVPDWIWELLALNNMTQRRRWGEARGLRLPRYRERERRRHLEVGVLLPDDLLSDEPIPRGTAEP